MATSRIDRTDDTAAVLKIIATEDASEDAVTKQWQGVYVADATSPAANKLAVDASGHAQVDIAADSAGLATSANQLADGHNVTVDNAGGASAVNVQDGGNDISVDNAGTFAVQDSQKVADNTAFTDGTTPVQPTGGIFDEVAGTALTENDIAASRIDSKRAQVLVIEDETTRGRRATVTASNELSVIDASTATIATNTTDLNNAIGTDGAAGPTRAVSIAGTNAGNLQEVNVDAAGDIQVDVLTVPANQSVNVAQIAGTATSVNSGAGDAGTQRVVWANDEALPAGTNNIGDVDVNSVVPVTATGTHTAVSTAVTIDVGGYGSVAIQLTGTWTATVGFDASVDGTNFEDLEVVPTSSTTAVTTATANGIWYADVGGLNVIRTFTDAFTSGTVQVDMQANVASGKASTAASTGGTSATDDSVFTGGSTAVTPIGAIFDATPPTITDGNVGAPRMNTDRVMLQDLFQVGGTAIETGGVAGAIGVGGLAADGAAPVGDPVLIAGQDGAPGNVQVLRTSANGSLSSGSNGTPADATSNSSAVVSPFADSGSHRPGFETFPMVFNGTTWDRIRGDTSGLDISDISAGTQTNNVNTNTAQVAGTATSVNAGAVDAGTQRVVLANNEALPAGTNNIGDVDVASVTPVTATGTMTAVSQSVTIDVGGYGSVGIQLSGVWTATVGFDANVDGSNWEDLEVVPTNSTTAVTTATANGIWYADVGGLNQIRVFTDAFTSGTVQADLQANVASGKASTAASTGGTSATDDTAFTGGSTAVTPVGYIFDGTPPSITDGNVGGARMNTNRVAMQDLFQVGGTATSVNAGNVDAGTQRVVLPNDQASLTVDAPVGTPVATRQSDGTAFIDEADDDAIAAAQNAPRQLSLLYGFDGTNWERVQTDAAGAIDINDGGNIITVDGTVTSDAGTGFPSVATDAAAHGGSQTGTRAMGTDGTNDQQIAVDATGNVQVDVLTFPDNEPFNMAQVAATATSVNNGTADAGTQRVAIASDNTAFIQPLTATGTMTAVSQSVTLDVDGYGGAGFQLSGTWTATVGFDCTIDGTNWQNLEVFRSTDGTPVTDTGSNGIFFANCGGLQQVRVFTDAFTSGTVQADLQANIASGKNQTVQVNGTGLITTVNGVAATDGRSNTATEQGGLVDVNNNDLSIGVSPSVFNGTTWDRQRGSTTGTQAIGGLGHDIANTAANNPVVFGGHAVDVGATPTAVAAADVTRLLATRYGQLFTLGGHMNSTTREYVATTAQTNDPIIDTIAAGNRIVITKIGAYLSNATTVDVGVRIGFGTASVPAEPADGATVDGMALTHPGIAAGSGTVEGDGSGIVAVGGDGEELRITNDVPTSGRLRVLVTFFTFAA